MSIILTLNRFLFTEFSKSNLRQLKNVFFSFGNKKVDLNCSNRYETLYIIDSNTDSERDDSDGITITDTPTDNNRQPGHTHRSHQRNVKRGNDTRVRNAKQSYVSF